MLCGKIIITNEGREEIQTLLDSIRTKKAFFATNDSKDAFVISINADDESLYEICKDLASYISERYMRPEVCRYIEKVYTCFNGDEKERIYQTSLNCQAVSELAGRIYVFMKTEEKINLYGFYKFMCTDISAAVLSEAETEAERLISLNDTEDFINLLRQFAAMSPLSAERVDIVAKKHSIRIINSDPGCDYNAEFASLDPMPEDILSELVALNPQKIVIHGKSFYDKSEFSVIINGVFKDRVSYCEGCSLCFES